MRDERLRDDDGLSRISKVGYERGDRGCCGSGRDGALTADCGVDMESNGFGYAVETPPEVRIRDVRESEEERLKSLDEQLWEDGDHAVAFEG